MAEDKKESVSKKKSASADTGKMKTAITEALAILDPHDAGAPIPGSPGQNIKAIAILRKAIGKE